MANLSAFLGPAQAKDELGRLGGFRILEILGCGGMGVVFRGEDPRLGRQVAIKAMLPHLAVSSSSQQRFLREARAAAGLEHDHIVPILQIGEDRGMPFIVMPFLKGEPLDRRIQREPLLPIAEVLRIGREVATGLAIAHAAGLVHRDIKPGNIWLESSGDSGGRPSFTTAEGSLTVRVKILDFGLARAARQGPGLTREGAIIGTPAFMAPEQARGEAVDARCDLFSLGVVLYRLCTGKQPFEGDDAVSTLLAVVTEHPPSPHKLNPGVPQGLSALVMQLMQKDPAQRPASAEEVAAALRELEHRPQAPVVTTTPLQESRLPGNAPTRAPARKAGGAILLLLAAMVLAAIVAAGIYFMPAPRASSQAASSTPPIPAITTKDRPASTPLSTRANAIRNPSFRGLEGWHRLPTHRIVGLIIVEPREDALLLERAKTGNDGGRIGVFQELDLDVSAASRLEFSIEVRVERQGIPGTNKNRPAPAKATIIFLDNEGKEHTWEYGFLLHVRNQLPANMTIVPRGTWFRGDFDLLDDKVRLDLEGTATLPRPARIKRLELLGSGWDLTSWIRKPHLRIATEK
jgi:serine/threonine protein kinase